ncbi:MAG TPA: stalk domain-containing protein, partial [Halanaerobiales bacterium]|nr:stalk domain-containing protein [Halanaerobiales bacterium]
GFEYNELPIELTPLVYEKRIRVAANDKVVENLGLYISGTIDGYLTYQDPDNNKEFLLSGIYMTAEPGGYTACTDRHGYFYFEQLPVGKYRISINTDTLPEWAEIMGEVKELEITEAGEYCSGIEFNLHIKPEYLQKEEEEPIVIKTEKASGKEDAKQKANESVYQEKTDKEKTDMQKEVKEIDNDKEDKDRDTEDDVLVIDLDKKLIIYRGEEMEMNPFCYHDSNQILWIPLRPIYETTGVRVHWNTKLKQITILEGEKRLLINLREKIALKDQILIPLEDEITITENHTYFTAVAMERLGFGIGIENNVLYIEK